MRYRGFGVLGVVIASMVVAGMPLDAQRPANAGEPALVGPDVTAPRLIHKVNAAYSPEARASHVQGTVVLQTVIDEKGRPTNISVISPFGFGLDERAQAAVAKWVFAPGMKAGVPVKVLATVEVTFRLAGTWFDSKAERQRTAFNVALQTLSRPNDNPAVVDRAVQSMLDLYRQKFAPAAYIIGMWKVNGEHGPKDVAAGLELIQKAAEKNYAPAVYEVAVRRINGRDLPQDFDKGLEEMREAATMGSAQAQFHLGNRYETGNGVPRELDRARRYFRLCATQGFAFCQYRLGRLLYDAPDRPERDYLQAIALFQLAAEQGVAEALQLASAEAPKLTAEQARWVTTLKRQIVRK